MSIVKEYMGPSKEPVERYHPPFSYDHIDIDRLVLLRKEYSGLVDLLSSCKEKKLAKWYQRLVDASTMIMKNHYGEQNIFRAQPNYAEFIDHVYIAVMT